MSFVTRPVLGAVPSFLALAMRVAAVAPAARTRLRGVALAGSLLLNLICDVARSWNGEPSEVQGDGGS